MAATCVTSVNEEQFSKEVLAEPGTVLVDFYTANCPPCRQVAPVLEELCVAQCSRLKIVKVDAAENLGVAIEHKVSAVPTFVLYHARIRIGQISGYQSRDQFEKWIESSLSGAA